MTTPALAIQKARNPLYAVKSRVGVPLRRAPPNGEPPHWSATVNPREEKTISYLGSDGQQRAHTYMEAQWGGPGDYPLI